MQDKNDREATNLGPMKTVCTLGVSEDADERKETRGPQ